ncbi:hypothetical protein [Piscirickettsia litoralis]|uniref:Uncharacterized protein n=1 Tax=Piscirickettsia litoralis TaxID=1891921 RepID=A0ABX3A6Y8_9GAMM|nr:hypothetical protein [Piscirickettsia litoralis]ODN43280.1 hypothetical protein BGC07_10565 [Piscirickettsia litoralis]
MKLIAIALLFSSLIVPASISAASKCSGNGCKYVTFGFWKNPTGGYNQVRIKNNSSNTIRVKYRTVANVGQCSGYFIKTLAPHQYYKKNAPYANIGYCLPHQANIQ